jgi:hypothetical protein
MLDCVPVEVFTLIFDHLDFYSSLQLRLCCSKFQKLASGAIRMLPWDEFEKFKIKPSPHLLLSTKIFDYQLSLRVECRKIWPSGSMYQCSLSSLIRRVVDIDSACLFVESQGRSSFIGNEPGADLHQVLQSGNTLYRLGEGVIGFECQETTAHWQYLCGRDRHVLVMGIDQMQILGTNEEITSAASEYKRAVLDRWKQLYFSQ